MLGGEKFVIAVYKECMQSGMLRMRGLSVDQSLLFYLILQIKTSRNLGPPVEIEMMSIRANVG